jgi:CheY-like chemotaxis protein
MKVLIADDEIRVRKAFEKLLLEENYEVITAVDGKDAVSKHKKYQSDIIFMDMQMPHWNGLIASEKIRLFDPIVPIIALTNFVDEYQEKDTNSVIDHWTQKSDAIYEDKIDFLLDLIKFNNKKVFQSRMSEWITNIESNDILNEETDFLKAVKCLKNLLISKDGGGSLERLMDLTTLSVFVNLSSIFKKFPKEYYRLMNLLQYEMPEQHLIKSKIKQSNILKLIEDFDDDIKLFNLIRNDKLN